MLSVVTYLNSSLIDWTVIASGQAGLRATPVASKQDSLLL